MIETALNDIKERMSIGLVTLIAGRAGCELSSISVDRTSVDVTIRPVKGERVCIDAQLKSSSVLTREGEDLIFDLPSNNYNDLVKETVGNARILIVLDLHNDDAVWLVHNEESVILQRLAYWLDLYGQEPTSNPKRKRVRIPLAQKFTAESLTQIMEKRYANILQSLGGVM